MSHYHFTLSNRIKLEGFLDEGKSIVECASLLDKNPSSVHGEDRKARKRRTEANKCHLILTSDDNDLSIVITRYLKKRWSPEQISACLKLGKITINGVKKKVIVAIQTIYDWIYRFL